jgi:hypothetical protein
MKDDFPPTDSPTTEFARSGGLKGAKRERQDYRQSAGGK